MSESPKLFTIDDLKANGTRKSMYLLLHKKVYDVTKFMDEHPGGDEVLVAEAGQDATDAFEDVGHSDDARELLADYLIGEFDETNASSKKAASGASKAANSAVASGSSLMYFLPLTGLVAFFAWQHFSAQA